MITKRKCYQKVLIDEEAHSLPHYLPSLSLVQNGGLRKLPVVISIHHTIYIYICVYVCVCERMR